MHYLVVTRISTRLVRFSIIMLLFVTVMTNHCTAKENAMSNNALSIQQTQAFDAKTFAKACFGRLATALVPKRSVELFKDPICSPNNVFDRAILFHLRQRALKEGREKFFERLHKNFWAGQGGAVFAQNCDHRFRDLFLNKQYQDFEVLKYVWESLVADQIVELGTNSGLLLNYLTENLVEVTSSIGIDVNPEQILKNQNNPEFDPRIEFVNADGKKWIVENGNPFSLFVSNGGVLEYFSRERLNQMMSHISTHCHPSIFYASEPVATDHDYKKTKDSVPFGNELSFSHNYTDLFESNGFKIVHQRDVMYDNWKMLTTIAITQS